jgi:phospholipid/cholesterol/gamma-HCH transport system substrate-binding protein
MIATMESIPGLNPQASVRYRGLEVGKVDDIEFNSAVPGQILIHLSIDPDAPITKTTFAKLGYQGVTGIAFINLDDDHKGSPLLRSDRNHIAAIPLRQGFLDQLERRGEVILKKTEEITARIDQLVAPENQERLLGALDSVGKAAEAYAAIPKQLEPTLKRLPELTARADQSMASLKQLSSDAASTVQNYDKLATTLQAPNGPIQRLTATVDRAGATLEGVSSDLTLETLPHVVSMTEEARTSLRAVKRTANSLTDRPQGLLFGATPPAPGPGEPGFVAPPAK